MPIGAQTDSLEMAADSPATVADQAEHQRVLANQVGGGRRHVKGETSTEAGQHAFDRAAGQGQGNHHDQHEVGSGRTRPGQVIEQGDLDQDGEQQQRGRQRRSPHVSPPIRWRRGKAWSRETHRSRETR